ncbi:hypothetical protein DAPPUDRAFT_237268 [Daphnia pulex]|uniref:Uncharacterized protein n=1 Tax=Daphnia pulex TaxID=6669 RepID=E9G3I1_DAPPU|nr:hypothetical protein DAPPUDRAFT_237268 [Daphnia pulex]|eukprot:EFX85983.1 hypothetical protein DAPPUDRAFT_237268 [Daphnia pulex]
MSKLSILLVLIVSMSSALASLNLHGQPLLSGLTSFTLELETITSIKPTPCYVTSGQVSQCRRKRGMEERPFILHFDNEYKIMPSAVVRIEPTTLPRSISPMNIFKGNKLAYNKVYSSFDDSLYNSHNIFRQLAMKGRNNVISVGDCGMSTVNFNEFLSCLGMTVQETTTLTATFTETYISSVGYNTWTVMGCTPAGFPYPYCPTDSTPVTDPIQSSTTELSTSESSTTEFPTTDSTGTESIVTVTPAPPPPPTTTGVIETSSASSPTTAEPIAP